VKSKSLNYAAKRRYQKNIDELKTNYTDSWFEVYNLLKLIDVFILSSFLKSFSHFKKQGFNFDYVLSVLPSLLFESVTGSIDIEPRIAMQIINEASLCKNRVREKTILPIRVLRC